MGLTPVAIVKVCKCNSESLQVTIFLHIYFNFLNKFWNFVYEVRDALHKSFFPSSRKSCVTDFRYSFFLFSDRMSIIEKGDRVNTLTTHSI
jgi:hypothetical protein